MTSSSISKWQWALLLSSPLVSLIFCLEELWRHHPAQHFFPLALMAAVLLAVRQIRSASSQSSQVGAAPWLMGAHLALALISFVFASPFLAGLAVISAALAFDVALWNRSGRQRPDFYLSALSVFLVPPPLGADETFRQLLARWATNLSQAWLDDLGVLNIVEGSVVVTAGRRFFVDDACSGINSMLVVMCAALIFCAFQKRSWLHALVLLVSTGAISIASNILRILVVIYGTAKLGVGLDKGMPHELVGGASFLLDLFLVWSADCGLRLLLRPPVEETFNEPAPKPPAHSAGLAWVSRGSFAVACVGLALIVSPQFLVPSAHADTVSLDEAQKQEFELPARLGDWERQGDKPLENAVIGDLSVRNVVWLYRHQGREAYVALNFPFVGIHDTRLCYLGQGWQLRKQSDQPMAGEKDSTVRVLDLFQPVERSTASLRLVVFDQSGQVLPYPKEDGSRRLGDRFLQRWKQSQQPFVTYTLQVLVPDSLADAGAVADVEALLKHAREEVSRVLSPNSVATVLNTP